MLRPIPQSLLGDMMTLKVCIGMDAWQNPSWQDYTVQNVHIQNTNEVKKTKENTEVVLRSILFIDSSRSTPSLDYDSLAEQSQKAGKPLRCIVSNSHGQKYGEYEVLTVDPVPDVPATRIHHIELGLV
nr:MAG TPA: Minor capsid protein [Caudoviricetes sp.]